MQRAPKPPTRTPEHRHEFDARTQFCEVCGLSAEAIIGLSINECPGHLAPARRARLEYRVGR
jgi:hypothetical protein